MKWIKDTTGRFSHRPYFEDGELDAQCEAIITNFMLSRSEQIKFPVSTDALTILIEQHVDDLDLFADLSQEGADVQGVTEFFRDSRPRVRIARELSESRRENRLRTTLTHELGHVVLHDFLLRVSQNQAQLIGFVQRQPTQCKRENILNARSVDWLEWQAGYASGAFLMPQTPVREIVQETVEATRSFGKIFTSSAVGRELISQVQNKFQVSAEAARIRLLKLKHLSDSPTQPTLFS